MDNFRVSQREARGLSSLLLAVAVLLLVVALL